ncbi:BTAD domain-containing putative transcriptional regulator [Streptomyces sp. AN091965]|uniref:BTAD domain-containing putative transcriptional regulator n=1 Tax=Streptomyces sp. AN091965 TaxID=2927803 RepID=UPI001F6099FC|nr:BTAD domain-containing putative transcriptional regulator [Streptomyces sp. AN091965]MCI3931408.1 AAA family ATPase [Streptomyces sp. AN091965]
MELRVLGAVEAWDDGRRADLRGPRHRAVLARLLMARGRVVPLDQLIDDLWRDTPAERALGSLRTLVSTLRKALEPGRPTRTPPRTLVTAPPGYALRLDLAAVDAWRFEDLVRRAAEPSAPGRAAETRDRLTAALELWRGGAYAEFAAEAWAAPEVTRLSELRLLAAERLADAELALGAAARVVADLEAHTRAHPLREEGWRLFALALYRTGRQADALSALRTARAVLKEELGIDPGPALRTLEEDILRQCGSLAGAVEHVVPPSAVVPAAGGRPAGRDTWARPEAPRTAQEAPAELPGRAEALERLAQEAQHAAKGGALRVALVGGAPGTGKTALAEAAAHALTATHGWTATRGRCPEETGAPPAHPWAELLRTLVADGHPAPPALAPLLDPAAGAGAGADAEAARFRTHTAATAHLAAVARRAPLAVVLEDLHHADDDTLTLLRRLPTALAESPVLLLVTFRTEELTDAVRDTLAALARCEPARMELQGLDATAVGAVLRELAGHAGEPAPDLDEDTVRRLAERTGGNPFFVRETARLLAAEGVEAALTRVPPGVADVIRHRLGALSSGAQGMLRRAAVAGTDLDIDVFLEMCAADGEGGPAHHGGSAVEHLEEALGSGLLGEPGPGRLRFASALVRDTLYQETSRLRRAHWHARAADAVERLRPDDLGALAHHRLESAGPRDVEGAVRHVDAAATAARQGGDHQEAARLWRRALVVHERLGTAPLVAGPEGPALVVGLVRSLTSAGDFQGARAQRVSALERFPAGGAPEALARLVACDDMPTLWFHRDYAAGPDPRVTGAVERLLAELPDSEVELRCRMHAVLARELDGFGGERAVRAAAEAERLARRTGDPRLLVHALNSRLLQTYGAAGLAPRRARVAEEMLSVARGAGLGAAEAVARTALLQAHAARAAFREADEQAAAVRGLAAGLGMPALGLVPTLYGALRPAAAHRHDEAGRRYAAARDGIGGLGLWGAEHAVYGLALFCLRQQDGRLAEHVDLSLREYETWGRGAGCGATHALTLAAAGRGARARALLPELLTMRRDFLYELRLAAAGLAAVRLGEDDLAEAAYEELLPAADELAGAGSGMVTLGPVAQYLGEIAEHLGRADDAVSHYCQALSLARRAGAPHWQDQAQRGLRRLAPASAFRAPSSGSAFRVPAPAPAP